MFVIDLCIDRIITIQCCNSIRQISSKHITSRVTSCLNVNNIAYSFTISNPRIIDEIDVFHKFWVQ